VSDGFASWLEFALRVQSWQINYLPIVQHKPGIALKPRSRLVAPINGNEGIPGRIPQSASLLHLNYGRNLGRNVAASDAFYALHEHFCFAAFSELQFLKMLESKLRQELDQSFLVRQQNPTLSNLLYNQQVLDRQIQRIRDNLASIRSRSSAAWPRGPLEAEKQRKADLAANKLLQDYEHLLSRGLTLSGQCNRDNQVVMNNAMIKESRKAISQPEGVAKLTRLAFFLIPISFTTSFPGMNFVRFGQGHLSIWIWFVVALLISALSLLLIKCDVLLC
jgi:Mg2+ and Co2+ transporter CorA